MAEETGDETVADVLERVGALKKDEMIEEVEAYGLEVHSSWTKDEIMDNFEEFLNKEPALADDDDDDADERDTTPVSAGSAVERVEGAPSADVPDPVFNEANLAAEEFLRQREIDAIEEGDQVSSDNPSPEVRLTTSRAWGRTGQAYAP